MSNTAKTENITDDFIDYLLDPVTLFADTLDQITDGGICSKEKLDEDVKRFCERYPEYQNGILKYIFQGFVLGMQRADIIYGNFFLDDKKGSDATTAETTK